jgi:hypothetical protein
MNWISSGAVTCSSRSFLSRDVLAELSSDETPRIRLPRMGRSRRFQRGRAHPLVTFILARYTRDVAVVPDTTYAGD